MAADNQLHPPGIFQKINSKIEKYYECSGDDLTYGALKNIAGIQEEDDVVVKNVLKTRFHSYVTSGKVYGLKAKKKKINLLECLQYTVEILGTIKDILCMSVKIGLPLVILFVVYFISLNAYNIEKNINLDVIYSIIGILVGTPILYFLWKMI
jgi:hypothetical protein